MNAQLTLPEGFRLLAGGVSTLEVELLRLEEGTETNEREAEVRGIRTDLATTREHIVSFRWNIDRLADQWERTSPEGLARLAPDVRATLEEHGPHLKSFLWCRATLRGFARPRSLLREAQRTCDEAIEEYIRWVKIVLVYFPEFAGVLAPEYRELVSTVRIPWWAYLRSLWNLFWTAIRHPLSETTIDLSTGRVLYRT